MKKITNIQLRRLKKELPSIKNLLEGDPGEYQMIFISIFDHWLTEKEFNQEIHTSDLNEIASRRHKFEKFLIKLNDLTPTYLWKYKKRKRFYIYPVDSIKQLLSKCDIQNQNGESGQRYDILLPELNAVYSEEWDWTNIVWFNEREKIEPIIEMANKIGLNILEKN